MGGVYPGRGVKWFRRIDGAADLDMVRSCIDLDPLSVMGGGFVSLRVAQWLIWAAIVFLVAEAAKEFAK